eukprot:COSAG01_NODE_8552_length_2744_cov_8.662382_2_plen_54_part_00
MLLGKVATAGVPALEHQLLIAPHPGEVYAHPWHKCFKLQYTRNVEIYVSEIHV